MIGNLQKHIDQICVEHVYGVPLNAVMITEIDKFLAYRLSAGFRGKIHGFLGFDWADPKNTIYAKFLVGGHQKDLWMVSIELADLMNNSDDLISCHPKKLEGEDLQKFLWMEIFEDVDISTHLLSSST